MDRPDADTQARGVSAELEFSVVGESPPGDTASDGVTDPVTQSANTFTPVSVRKSIGIAERLREFIEDRSMRQIATDTGFHPESVRRYMRGASTIPAEFVGAVCAAYGLDAMAILLDGAESPYRQKRHQATEERLTESLVQAMGPQLEEWMRENIVPYGRFFRSTVVHPISQEHDALDGAE